MKKIVMSSVIASVLGLTSAFADPISVASQSYVDSGLQAVYNNVNGKITNVNTVIGSEAAGEAPATGLIGDVRSLETDVSGLQDDIGAENENGTILYRIKNLEDNGLQSGDIQGGAGVSVSNGVVSVNGLSAETATDDKIYVLKNNEATELDVQTTWTTPNWLY